MMTLRARIRALLLLTIVAASLFAVGPGMSLARYASARAVGGNALTSGYWATYYLHNNPPGATKAQPNLTATTTASTEATLYDYDTDCDTETGRRLVQVNSPTPGNTTLCQYVNWRLPVRATALTLTGSVTADVWAATQVKQGNRDGSIIAYLRDYNPGTGTYFEIANATYTGNYVVGRTFYERSIAILITGTYTLAIGHRLELKLEAPRTAPPNDMMVAYDTTGYPSYLQLP